MFAAFDVASGSVIVHHYRRHRQEFLRFLKLIDTAIPKELETWTKSADQILDTLTASCQRINDSGH